MCLICDLFPPTLSQSSWNAYPLLLPFSPHINIVLAPLCRCLRRLPSLESLAQGSSYNFDPHTTIWGGSSGWGPTTWPSFPPLSSPSSDSGLASDSDTDNAGSAVDGPIDYASDANSDREDVTSSSSTLSTSSTEWGSTLPLGDVVSGTDLSGEWARISRWGAGTTWDADDLWSILRAPSPPPAEETIVQIPPSIRSQALERWVQHGFHVDAEPIEQAWAVLDPLTPSTKTRRDLLNDLKWTALDAYRTLSTAHPDSPGAMQVDQAREILAREIVD
ncbi:hypothetical protein DFH08DRAFT_953230 [Mycena albidolilacea]|uniref:Uncharacterized protein n=1 Tax=Mycena albidolilacea TaxID=1033008 RepID=A0AAD7EYB6_9AGAR|nr:hypothetical protein DFH08DRAFT_953230 [Mycena albidolilacea]